MQVVTRKADKLIERNERMQTIRRERNDAESRVESLEKLVGELSVVKQRALER